jgi:hypothetical protein
VRDDAAGGLCQSIEPEAGDQLDASGLEQAVHSRAQLAPLFQLIVPATPQEAAERRPSNRPDDSRLRFAFRESREIEQRIQRRMSAPDHEDSAARIPPTVSSEHIGNTVENPMAGRSLTPRG